MWCCCILLVVALASHAQADIFSSTEDLRKLLHVERHLVRALKDYVEKTVYKISQVKRYLEQFDAANVSDEVSGDEVVENPLQAYHLVRRLAVEWQNATTEADTDDFKPIRELVHDYQHLLPSNEDLEGAALALVRLQDTYRLNTTEVANGDVLGLPQGTTLSARDLLYLGKQSAKAGYYPHAIWWLEEAVQHANLEGNTTASVTEIMEYKTTVVDTHDGLFERTDIDLDDYYTFGHPLRGDSSSGLEVELEVTHLGPDITSKEQDDNYKALCRGERLVSAAEESRLSCKLDNRGHPSLLLRPLRVEERGLEPRVVQFHDLLTDGQADILRKIAEPQLSRSFVLFEGKVEVSSDRISHNTWIDLHEHPILQTTYQLVEAATGLSTDCGKGHAETLQIANYGMAGMYFPHHDYLQNEKEVPEYIEHGDRTATLMFYLSDVTKGGATVFPKVGASVWPKKGSAVFWYNLKLNGEPDPMTLHGGCPVAVGSKWVANVWIHEIGQTFRRRCPLNPVL